MNKNIFFASLLFIGSIINLASSTPVDITKDNIFLNSKTVQVIGLFRHGARFEESTYYATPTEMTQIRLGELTTTGVRQMYNLGEFIKQEYIKNDKLLSEEYVPSEIYLRSTDKNRTLTSAQSFALGLYPGTASNDYTNPLKIEGVFTTKPPFLGRDNKDPQSTLDSKYTAPGTPNSLTVIPVHSISTSQDKVLYTHGSTCKNFSSWRDENAKSADWDRITKMYQKDMDYILNKLSSSYPNIKDIDLYKCYEYVDEMISRRWRMDPTLAVPKAFQENNYQLYYKLQEIAHLEYFLVYFKSQRDIQTISTPFFADLLQYMNLKIKNPDYKQKFIGLFAHDTTIGMVLNALNLVSWECLEKLFAYRMDPTKPKPADDEQCIDTYVQFASNIIFELRQHTTSNQYYVGVRYNGEYFKICNSKNYFCSYTEFKDQYTKWQVNFDKECGNTSSSTNTKSSSQISNNQITQVEKSEIVDDSPVWALVLVPLFGSLFIITFIYSIYAFLKMKRLTRFDKETKYNVQLQQGSGSANEI